MKYLKRLSLIFLLFFVLFSVNVFADYEIGELDSPEDPLNSIKYVDKEDEKAINENVKNGISVMSALPNKQENISTIISKFENGTAAVGIDVSAWQEDIDWKTVANSGVKYAILRCGYRGTTGGQIFEDKYFKKNIEGAINNGIYVGVYFYSTAINEQEAIEEANMTLNLIKGYDVKYFVAYDFEDFTPKGNRTDNLDVNQINKNALAFLSKIRENGYNACLYGSASFFTDYWQMDKFSSYDVWTAHYYVSKPNSSRYNIWQYTDSGIVPGIKGNVDVDIDYTYYFRYNNIDITPYMFNATFYADCNPDVKAAFGSNATLLKNHYDKYGKKEGRIASPIFNPKYYRDKYSDLKKAYGNDYSGLYKHFIDFGSKEGRQGSKYINSVYYLDNHADLRKAFYSSKTRALAHFFTNGISEGRQGSKEFNVKNYKNSTSSYYKNRLGNNYLKYIALNSGGIPVSDSNVSISSYMFDARFYADKYPDIKAAFGYNETALKNHFNSFGKKEGRQGSRIFDPKYYASTYKDIKSAYGTNYSGMYDHFIKYGASEGRAGSKELNVKNYIKRYPDLETAYGPFYTKAIVHYVSFGVKEGRKGN